MSDLDAFLDNLSLHQLGWPESLRFTYDATRRLLAEGVPGDLVECGVGTGCHPAVMARACMDAGETRTVRLFDSFAGLPHGRADKDVEWSQHYGDGSGRLEATGVAACSEYDVARNLARWFGPELDRCRFQMHKGWFQETVPEYAEMVVGHAHLSQPIAFLRLDGDLFESTKVCLEHLYPFVSSGGAIVVDDWNLDGCREAVRDYFTIAGQHVTTITLEHMLDIKPITESGDVWWTKP